MHQTSFCKGAWDLKLCMNKWKLYVHVLILRQNNSLSSLTGGKTSLWGGWKSLPIRTCGRLGYSATCYKAWSRKAANCKPFAWSLAPLLICLSNLNSQIDVHVVQQQREKPGLLEAPDSVQRPRVSRYGLKTLLCIFWNSPGVLHGTVWEMSLMATPYAKYHKLTSVARSSCSLCDSTSENCGSVRLEENARKHTANLRTTTFLH